MLPGAKHQGVACSVEAEARTLDLEDILDGLDEPALILVLDGVQDPHNLGACLRIADAMGVHAVVAPKDRAVGLTPVVEKVASGAVETVPYVMVTNLARTLEMLQERAVFVVGLAGEGEAELPTRRPGRRRGPGARRRGRGAAAPDARALRHPGADSHVRIGGEPERLGRRRESASTRRAASAENDPSRLIRRVNLPYSRGLFRAFSSIAGPSTLLHRTRMPGGYNP